MPVGEIASLLAACCWAVGLNLFRRDVTEIGSGAVNLFKGMVGSTLFLLTLALSGFPEIGARAQAYLVVSGVVGFALGDTFLFFTLSQMGPHRAALFGSLGPVFTALGAWTLLGETLGAGRLLGIALAAGGVAVVVYFRRGVGAGHATGRGVVFGILAAVCHACGVLLTKRGLEDADALAASTLRLTAATVVLALAALGRGRLGPDLARLFRRASLSRLVPAALIGTFTGIWLMQVGIERTESAVANALHSTTPLFTLVIAVFVLRERIGALPVLGSLVAVAGVLLLFLS